MPHKMKEELERKLKISRMGGGLPDTCDAVGPILAEEREAMCSLLLGPSHGRRKKGQADVY